MDIPPPRPYEERSADALPWRTTLLGNRMQHNYWIYSVIDRVMIENPQIKSIVEIGTGFGCMTTIFGLWGIHRNIPVISIDKVHRHHTHVLQKLGVEYVQDDIKSEDVQNKILNIVNSKPTWIFCDGGCKREELKLFAPKIPKDSIISAHDLGVEFIHKLHGQPLCDQGILEPFHPEWWMEMNIQTAIYKKL